MKLFFLTICVVVVAENSSVKLIVKVKPGKLQYVEHVMKDYGFSLYRAIIDEIYTFESNCSAEDMEIDFILTEMRSVLSDKVEYLYESYDLFHSRQTWASVPPISYTAVKMLDLSQNLLNCSTVYDPMFGIDDAWKRDITGKGVVIAIIDVGVDINHPYLHPNIDIELSWNFVKDDSNISLECNPIDRTNSFWANHGNACAGLAAGSRNKKTSCQLCGSGVAPDASISVLKVGRICGDNASQQPIMHIDAVCRSLAYRSNDIHIYSNTWNFGTDTNDQCIMDSLKIGSTKGRNCKGNIFVFPADPTSNGFVNNIHTIAVGAMGINGTLPENYQTNSAVLVSAFGIGRKKSDTFLLTHRHMADNSPKCSKEFGGQHATIAIVSGIIALVLEVNPHLTAREIKHIMVESASSEDIAEEKSFKTNAAGYKYHQVYGFGYPNVTKMISMAKSLKPLPDLYTCSYNLNIEGKMAFKLIQFHEIEKLEQVEFDISFVSSNVSGITLKAISPKYTTSVLLQNVSFSKNSNQTRITLMSNHFWGEEPRGNWTLIILPNNRTAFEASYFSTATIILHGTKSTHSSKANNSGNLIVNMCWKSYPKCDRNGLRMTDKHIDRLKRSDRYEVTIILFTMSCVVVFFCVCLFVMLQRFFISEYHFIDDVYKTFI